MAHGTAGGGPQIPGSRHPKADHETGLERTLQPAQPVLAAAVRSDGRGCRGAADRLREYRQLAAGEGGGAAAGVRDATRARGGPLATYAAVACRERCAGRVRRRLRNPAGALGDSSPGDLYVLRAISDRAGLESESAHPRFYRGGVDCHRYPVRTGAGDARHAGRPVAGVEESGELAEPRSWLGAG